jgi:hypothetical protein
MLSINPNKRKKRVGVKKSTAIKLVEQLLLRIEEANSLPKEEVPRYIDKVAIFGSYLTDKSKLGYIDLFIEYSTKWKSYSEELDFLINEVGFYETVYKYYAERKVNSFIRNKKKSYSFHSMYEFAEFIKDKDFKCKILYDRADNITKNGNKK